MRKVYDQRYIINITSDDTRFERRVRDAIGELKPFGELEFHYAQSDEYMSCLIVCYTTGEEH